MLGLHQYVCLISEMVSIDLDFIDMVFTRLKVLCWRAESHHIKEGFFFKWVQIEQKHK